MRPWSRCNHSIFSPATALPSIQGHGGVWGMSPSMSPLGSEAKGPVNFSSTLSWCWAYLCCLTPHPAPNRVTMNTTFTVSRWLVLCWAHTLYAKPWANLLLAALIFPWVSGSPTQRLLLIKPWHTPHKALSRPKYNQRFNKYQNKTKKKITTIQEVAEQWQPREESRRIPQSPWKAAVARQRHSFSLSLSPQREENSPPPLIQGTSLQLVTHFGWLQIR